jgi:hypothetical protein
MITTMIDSILKADRLLRRAQLADFLDWAFEKDPSGCLVPRTCTFDLPGPRPDERAYVRAPLAALAPLSSHAINRCHVTGAATLTFTRRPDRPNGAASTPPALRVTPVSANGRSTDHRGRARVTLTVVQDHPPEMLSRQQDALARQVTVAFARRSDKPKGKPNGIRTWSERECSASGVRTHPEVK